MLIDVDGKSITWKVDTLVLLSKAAARGAGWVAAVLFPVLQRLGADPHQTGKLALR
ncbi:MULTISPECIES: hypothetical protein [Candidatus Accumulibacter]|uniref:hypothetical protein n=1 Tax=Accumulibacter sp. TaxID=2053492 RepID=UPI00145C7CB8|nr:MULTISPECIES: hypothetical protein [Candidatus Accumulibacter]